MLKAVSIYYREKKILKGKVDGDRQEGRKMECNFKQNVKNDLTEKIQASLKEVKEQTKPS